LQQIEAEKSEDEKAKRKYCKHKFETYESFARGGKSKLDCKNLWKNLLSSSGKPGQSGSCNHFPVDPRSNSKLFYQR